MSRFEHVITVDVPLRVAYDQWTQFESFPAFMEGIEKVVQRDDKTLEWTASIAGQRRTWTAEITDQTPDVRIAWKSTSGADNAGAVLFQPLDGQRTQITLKMDVDPEGVIENVGDAVGAVNRRVKGDLERFKEYIEGRQQPTGAWRGEIHGDDVRDPALSGSRTGGTDRR
jgi:uncharacterized membrane protein